MQMKYKEHKLVSTGRAAQGYNLYKCEECQCILASMPGKYEHIYYHHSSSPYFKQCNLGHVPSCDECKMHIALE